MLEITELVEDFKSLPANAYLGRHPYPVLLHQTNRGALDDAAGYATGVRSARRRATVMSQDPTSEVQTARSPTGLLIFPVRPLLETVGARRVVVGRDTACDVQLPYDKVSSAHAFFLSDRGDRWRLEDNSATNGTFVDGQRLPPHAPVPIESGAKIKLGTALLSFYLAKDFYDYLTALLRLAT